MRRILKKSCEQMSELSEASVALTVTSPPYWNAIDYDVHTSGDRKANYRPRQKQDYADYQDFLRRCFAEVKRVHAPGTFCAVVLGTILLDGTHTPLPFHFNSLMEKMGWRFHQDIIWHKCTAGVKRAGSFIQNPYPGYYYPNIMTEYILVYRSPGRRKIYRGRDAATKEAAKVDIDSVFTKDIANNVWHIAPVPPRQYNHPCPFPEEIPFRLIRLYSYPGELVLDPFVGVGTTLKVAEAVGRDWVGYEVKQEYIDEAYQRIGEPLRLRDQLVVDFGKIPHGARIQSSTGRRAPFPRPRRGAAAERGLF